MTPEERAKQAFDIIWEHVDIAEAMRLLPPGSVVLVPEDTYVPCDDLRDPWGTQGTRTTGVT